MSKRFTDTELWKQDWFMELSPAYKCAFMYVLSQCDGVGVWKPNFKLANYQIGAEIDWTGFSRRVNGNIEILPNGKWWIIDFIKFQYGALRENFRLHQTYITLLHKHGLYERVMDTRGTMYPQELEQEQELELEQDKNKTRKTAGDVAVEKEIYHALYNIFKSELGYDFKKDGKAIKDLIAKARGEPRTRDKALEFLLGVVEVYRRLVRGKDKFWRGQPFLPSALNSGGIWPRVLKEIENRAGEQAEKKQAFLAAQHKPLWSKP